LFLFFSLGPIEYDFFVNLKNNKIFKKAFQVLFEEGDRRAFFSQKAQKGIKKLQDFWAFT